MPLSSPLPRPRGAAPRRVADLAFAEILVVWALRRFAGSGAQRGNPTSAIAAEFSRALGIARLEESLAAFDKLAGSLIAAARLPQAIALVEDDRINASEEAVLSILAAFQQGEEVQALALCEWCLRPQGRKRFIEGARSLAAGLEEAGHKVLYEAPRRRALVLSSEDGDGKLLAIPRDLAGLQPAERELIRGARLWVAAFRKNEDPLGVARQHFENSFNDPESGSGILWGDRRSGADAGLALHAVLRNTALAAARPVDLRCPNCPGLSPDEARLLEALAWLQRDQTEPARVALGDWLPAGALRLTLSPAAGLARALLTAEHLLPLRDWDFTALAATEVAAPQESTGESGEAEAPGAVERSQPTLH